MKRIPLIHSLEQHMDNMVDGATLGRRDSLVAQVVQVHFQEKLITWEMVRRVTPVHQQDTVQAEVVLVPFIMCLPHYH